MKQTRPWLVQPPVPPVRVALPGFVPSLAIALVLGSAACGGAAMGGAAAPASTRAAESQKDAAPSYNSIEEAERDLGRGERELAVLGPRGQGQAQPAAGATTSTPTLSDDTVAPSKAGQALRGEAPAQAAPPPPVTASAPPPADARSADEPAKEERPRKAPAPTPCETACHALSSMSRAADAICRMAGDSDVRCASARKRVEDSTARASSCHC